MSEAADHDADQSEAPPPTSRGRHLRATALIGVLLALLGFAIAVQLKTKSVDKLAGLREDDLITILDDQNSRADRLRDQIAQLQITEQQLQASGNRAAVARQQAEQQADALGILLGTLAATGPGVQIQITDPQHKLGAEDLLDVIEELRGAGAEAIQFGPVRVSTSTSFTASNVGVIIDGQTLQAPYTVLAIGDSQTLETALEIPGGVAATVRADGGAASISQQSKIDITALRTITAPRYAKPAGR
jgi:uncharacterized protein YlxW (UPF0749 family)